jgi:hypothetical protein
MPWDWGSKPELEVSNQFPLPFMGNEHETDELVRQLMVWTSLELLTLVKVKIGVTTKLELNVPPSALVVVKSIWPPFP